MISHKQIFRSIVFLCVCALVLFLLMSPLPAKRAKNPQRTHSTDPELRMKWFDQYVEMKKDSPFKDLKWRHVGPKNVSGRCTDIAVVAPKGENYTIYVATASGGVWKTSNEGTTWEPIFDQEASTSIGDVTIAPSNPEIVWIGTGEANIFRSSMAGCGVYKSTDAGKTWRHMGLTATNTIPRIVIHPENTDIVYVAASGHEWTDNKERGVYKTIDGGETWDKILYVNEKTGAIDLLMDPYDSNTLYAATWQRIRNKWNDPRNGPDYTGSGIYKTMDGGATWNPINNGLPEAKYRGRIGLDLCLSKSNVVYAFVDNYEIGREPTEAERTSTYGLPSSGIIKGATVYRSDDGGGSWIQMSGLTEQTKRFMMRHSGTYGWVFGQIRVDPNYENTVYIMGVPLSVSHDGGKTFKVIGQRVHVDHHGMWIDPDNSGYIVNVNDGGIAITYDKGKNWRTFTDNLPVCQFFNIGYDMDTPFRVYGSMQDHGSFRGVVDLSGGRKSIPTVDFERAPGGEGSSHAIDPTNPNIVYSAGFYGHLNRTDLSVEGRGGTKYILPRQFNGEPKLRGQWVAPFIISPHNNNIIYHGMQYLFRSRDRGDTWERISPDLTHNNKAELGDIPYQTVFSISESPLKFGLIYVGTDDGKVHVTKDGGKTWQEIMKGLPYQKWVSELVASAYNLGTVYMTQNGKRDDDFAAYVWKSTDYGKTWVDISGNIPLGPVNVIREDPANRNILYVGTDIGVYVTSDGGKTWSVLGGNLPSTFVHDLIIHPRDNIIVIATHGRGMWALDAEPINKMSQQRRRFR
ncbi:MAG: hypothetical protein JSV96_01375 [Candidatus Aminicenantes bacterium]|nr:MAG: hypothetical protein JSV96_01375 [Candidatus Aminicenantes bacterium]